MERIFRLVRNGSLQWSASDALLDEVRRNPAAERVAENEALLAMASEITATDERIAQRARELAVAAYGAYDALHLASRSRRCGRVGNPGFPCEIQYPATAAAAMTGLDKLTDQQFERHALEVLRRELGVDGLARFLRLLRSGSGDYTRDRAAWHKDLTVDQILESIKASRQ